MHGAGVAGAPPQGRVQVIRGLPLSAGAGEGVESCAPRDQVNQCTPRRGDLYRCQTKDVKREKRCIFYSYEGDLSMLVENRSISLKAFLSILLRRTLRASRGVF